MLARMRRGLAATIAVALALAAPATAQASYYMTKGQAESIARRYLDYTVGYDAAQAVCRPQFLKKGAPGYVYHRWTCGWAGGSVDAGTNCNGLARVTGSSVAGRFYWLTLSHHGPCPNGWG